MFRDVVGNISDKKGKERLQQTACNLTETAVKTKKICNELYIPLDESIPLYFVLTKIISVRDYNVLRAVVLGTRDTFLI